jgi:putative flippase GtrA
MQLRDWIDGVIERILGRKIKKGILQYFRYLISGGTATATDVALLFVFTHFFHFNYLITAAGTFLAGMIVNYTLNVILVFKSSGNVKREFPLFALIGLGGMMWTEVILWLLVGRLGAHLIVAKLVAILLVLQWNFFMRKKFVFYPEPVSEENIPGA